MTLSTRHWLFGATLLGITLMFAGVIGDLVDYSRQDMTASHLVLYADRNTLFREGFVFTLPEFAIEITDECSGIRSSIALVLTALLTGHSFLQRGWTRALLVVAVVTILKTGIRIIGLSQLSIHVDPAFLKGQLHRDGGVVFFLLALAMLAPVFAFLRRSEPETRSDRPELGTKVIHYRDKLLCKQPVIMC